MAIEIMGDEIVINKLTYKTISVAQSRHKLTDKWRAMVIFSVKDQLGRSKESYYLGISPEQYNNFFINYNSGKYLYELLAERLALDIEVSNDVEQEFFN